MSLKVQARRRAVIPFYAASTSGIALTSLVDAIRLIFTDDGGWKDGTMVIVDVVCGVLLIAYSAAAWREWATGPVRRPCPDSSQ